jgi:hypothetical protein
LAAVAAVAAVVVMQLPHNLRGTYEKKHDC